jgi:hypothetical protein
LEETIKMCDYTFLVESENEKESEELCEYWSDLCDNTEDEEFVNIVQNAWNQTQGHSLVPKGLMQWAL